MEPDEQRRFIRACGRCGSPRNAAIALLILYAGLRVEEVEALDIDDVVMSARCGKLIARDGKGGLYREVRIHHAARVALRAWLDARPSHRGADDNRALFLSRRGEWMLGARDPLRRRRARHGRWPWSTSPATPTPASPGSTHTPCATFATQLLRNGVVIVADLMGHATLDTTRSYIRSSETERARAVETALITDE